VTKDQKRVNITAEIARGESALRSAELLLTAGELADAISRAYYAAFHHARALLLTAGVEAKTHAGVERLLQRDFVHAGTLGPEVASLLSKLQTFRQNADYVVEYVFTAEMAREQLDDAETFISAVRASLIAGGWIAAGVSSR
jgi:uncharacterized protein (UPF0332 family)